MYCALFLNTLKWDSGPSSFHCAFIKLGFGHTVCVEIQRIVCGFENHDSCWIAEDEKNYLKTPQTVAAY